MWNNIFGSMKIIDVCKPEYIIPLTESQYAILLKESSNTDLKSSLYCNEMTDIYYNLNDLFGDCKCKSFSVGLRFHNRYIFPFKNKAINPDQVLINITKNEELQKEMKEEVCDAILLRKWIDVDANHVYYISIYKDGWVLKKYQPSQKLTPSIKKKFEFLIDTISSTNLNKIMNKTILVYFEQNKNIFNILKISNY